MGMVAYFRVSTKAQGESGLGLESQRAILCHYLQCDDLVAEFTEVASAKDITGRPILQEAIKLCVDGGHTLAVAKIDRLSRITEHALQIWGQLDARIYSCDIPQDNDKMDKFTLTIFMALADRERELIGIRTKAALDAAKARGVKLGNPDILDISSDDDRMRGAASNRNKAQQEYGKIAGYIAMMRSSGMSYRAIADRLNSEGHRTRVTVYRDGKTGEKKTRGGKPFHGATIKRIYDRLHIRQ